MRDLRYEDATPRPVTVEGYACHGCGRVHAGEDRARSCCATSYPCECGRRRERAWVVCRDCRDQADQQRWLAKPFTAWNCEFPVGEFAGYEMHWDPDSLAEAILLYDGSADIEITWQMVVDFCDARRVCKCEREPLREFCVVDFLGDALPEDCDLPQEQADRVDAAVNAILATEKFPESWTHVNQRIDPRAIAAVLGVTVIVKGGE